MPKAAADRGSSTGPGKLPGEKKFEDGSGLDGFGLDGSRLAARFTDTDVTAKDVCGAGSGSTGAGCGTGNGAAMDVGVGAGNIGAMVAVVAREALFFCEPFGLNAFVNGVPSGFCELVAVAPAEEASFSCAGVAEICEAHKVAKPPALPAADEAWKAESLDASLGLADWMAKFTTKRDYEKLSQLDACDAPTQASGVLAGNEDVKHGGIKENENIADGRSRRPAVSGLGKPCPAPGRF